MAQAAFIGIHAEKDLPVLTTKKLRVFFFALKPGVEGNCADFIQKTEEIIDIEKLGHKYSEFSKPTKPHCLWIKPSSFWSSCEIKRSFLTVLCRCGVNYIVNNDKDNYEDALFSINYFQLTQDATKRFLFGFTNTEQAAKAVEGQSSGSRGWHYVFNGKTAGQVKKLLAWPSGVPKPEIPVGLIEKDALWV